MQRLTWIDLLLGVIPENIVFILGSYVFSNTQIRIKKLLLSVFLISLSTYLVKLLPIQFGVHMFIFIMVFVLILFFINHIDIIKAVTWVLLLFIIRLVTEWITLYVLKEFFNISINTLLDEPMKKLLYTSPSLLMFLIVVSITYICKKRKNRKGMVQYVFVGKDIQ